MLVRKVRICPKWIINEINCEETSQSIFKKRTKKKKKNVTRLGLMMANPVSKFHSFKIQAVWPLCRMLPFYYPHFLYYSQRTWARERGKLTGEGKAKKKRMKRKDTWRPEQKMGRSIGAVCPVRRGFVYDEMHTHFLHTPSNLSLGK